MLDIGMKTLTVMGMLFFLYGVLTLITGRTRRDRIAGAVFIVWGIVNVIPQTRSTLISLVERVVRPLADMWMGLDWIVQEAVLLGLALSFVAFLEGRGRGRGLTDGQVNGGGIPRDLEEAPQKEVLAWEDGEKGKDGTIDVR